MTDEKAQGTQLVERSEAAKILGVATQTLAVWASTKRYALPYVKIGRRVKYRLSDLEAFIQARTVDVVAIA